MDKSFGFDNEGIGDAIVVIKKLNLSGVMDTTVTTT